MLVTDPLEYTETEPCVNKSDYLRKQMVMHVVGPDFDHLKENQYRNGFSMLTRIYTGVGQFQIQS